ncbi:yippee zinc-binding/DNA-binding /Mis18, centromere assembly-domain-containing protein [Mycotypha africana]|uniref:yippee zinc-binding/DNA-binding /Mis18, centromere assembly-domain-containing protein n=1 Tax=Mycotypha africana TaxID=64632 RepID=UPI0023010FEB|nr:yippee zinc-binding/DNA-binding /Mis18, centromere assembly-domain-containing protein [Mycotypha africana]KAI8977150.1 yippee zinc-binding/DNA-binding /Mis18, centromere assembly-domain-containing protein [Mycotypha africana]
MGITYRIYLDMEQHQYHKIYACSKCKSHLTTAQRLISKDFHGLHGKAYLFDKVVNVKVSNEQEERIMTTGRHCISFIACANCERDLGWKYVRAYEPDQKYKEGKYILEKCSLRMLNSPIS